MDAIERSTANEKEQVLVHLLRELIAARGNSGPISVPASGNHGSIAIVLPITSESQRIAVEEEAAFLAALDDRIRNPPERYLSSEEFLALIEQPQ